MRIEIGILDSQLVPDILFVIELSQLELVMRLAVIRVELGPLDRPAAVRDPVALLEIDWVEHSAAAAPDRHRTAEKSQPAIIELIIRHADVGALVERLRLRLEIEPAAFQQCDLVATFGQPFRQGNPRCARSDDADVAWASRGFRLGAQVDQHFGFQAGCQAALRVPAAMACCHQQLNIARA